MAKGVRVVVTKNNLPAIAAKLPVARRVILARRGPEMVEIAKRLSRYDASNTEPGHKHMRDGWEWHETNSGGALDNDVEHTVHNEYGTVHMSAQPMARPAAEQVLPRIVDDFQHLEDMLR